MIALDDKVLKLSYYCKLFQKAPHLISAQFNITNRCFSKCIMCGKPSWPQQDMEVELFRSALSQVLTNDCETIVFSGGEPLTHPKFAKFIDLIPYGIQIGLITSGVVDLQDFNFSRLNWIRVSLDAIDADIYKQVRGIDAVDKVIDFIKRHRNNTRLKISSTINKINFNEVAKLVEFADVFNVEISIYSVHTFKDLMLTEEQNLELEAKYYYNWDLPQLPPPAGSMSMRNLLFTKCIISKVHCIIDVDGSIFSCCRLMDDNNSKRADQNIRGNILTHSLKNILNDDIEVPKSPDCNVCDRYRLINYVYERFLNENITLFL